MDLKRKHKIPVSNTDLLNKSQILDEKYQCLVKLQNILSQNEYKKLRFIKKLNKTLLTAQESHNIFLKTASEGIKSLNEHTISCLKDSESQYNESSWFNKKTFNLNEENVSRFEKFMQNRLNTLQSFENSLSNRESNLKSQEIQLSQDLESLNSEISDLALAKHNFFRNPSFSSEISLTDQIISSTLFISIGIIIGFILLKFQHLLPFPSYF